MVQEYLGNILAPLGSGMTTVGLFCQETWSRLEYLFACCFMSWSISYPALADTDPLGVNTNVSFGGLDECERIILS